MNLLCIVFGHKIHVDGTTGLNPRTLKIIRRLVLSCDRCDFREQTDEEIADYDSKKGYNLWGSGGMCYGCEHKDSCESVPWKAPSFAGVWARCPIDNFKIESSAESILRSWKDTLIDYG